MIDDGEYLIYNHSMNFSLRPYQIEIINEARSLMISGIKSILIQLPTGGGKTLLAAQMLRTASERGMASLFICHRRELIKQTITAFNTVGVKHGVIANGFWQDGQHLIQLASVQTLARRIPTLKKPSLIVWDEAHHLAAGGWSKIYEAFPDAFHIGLSATPQRLDGQGLGKYFKHMIHGPSVRWLIDNKFLSEYKIFAPATVNLQGIHTRMGDYVQSELTAMLDKPTITGDAIKTYLKHAPGKRAVVFCVSVEHSKHVASQFMASGIQAVHVDGETPTEERDEAINRFKEGKIKVLSNVDLFGEGFDVPSMEVGILLRPTKSLGLYLQQIGRSLRPSDNKEFAIILDHAGNCSEHGLPDEERQWSLQGRSKEKGESQVSVRICQKCFGAMYSYVRICKYCGFSFPVESREVEQVAGELVEVDAEAMRRQRMREQGRLQTREELLELARKRGYKNPHGWVHMIMQARQAKKLRNGNV